MSLSMDTPEDVPEVDELEIEGLRELKKPKLTNAMDLLMTPTQPLIQECLKFQSPMGRFPRTEITESMVRQQLRETETVGLSCPPLKTFNLDDQYEELLKSQSAVLQKLGRTSTGELLQKDDPLEEKTKHLVSRILGSNIFTVRLPYQTPQEIIFKPAIVDEELALHPKVSYSLSSHPKKLVDREGSGMPLLDPECSEIHRHQEISEMPLLDPEECSTMDFEATQGNSGEPERSAMQMEEIEKNSIEQELKPFAESHSPYCRYFSY